MGAAVLIGLLGISPFATHPVDDSHVPIAAVRVDNLAAIPTDYLEFAEERAAAVFSLIGVRVTWIDAATAFREHQRPPFTVILIKSGAALATRPMIADALGFADPSVSRAHVMYDRVEALSAQSPTGAARLLGDVIAHELGHLMLRGPGHSARGIMRSGAELQVRAIETFTPVQARQIVARLSEAQ